MKIIFMGTPDFAVPVLERLIKEHQVVCVYTRAPKEAGRGKQVVPSPVHQVAERYGIEVRTPKTLRNEEAQKSFAALGADMAVVAAYGLILPRAVLEACPKGCLNVHASLLPRWRGAAPIQRSIEAGDLQSGVTIMKVVEALDAGPMYLSGSVELTNNMTGGKLHDRLAELGADLMSRVLQSPDSFEPQPQDESKVTYASKLEKSEARLDFTQSADVLERRIRAFNPFPMAFFEYNGERFQVLEADRIDENGAIGQIRTTHQSLRLFCGQGCLNIRMIRRQGKKAMPIAELLRGFAFEDGAFVDGVA